MEWGYFDQQKAVMEQAPPQQTVLENFWAAYPGYLREEVRSALGGFLFSGEDVEKKMGQLSGGEKVRLALCKMLQTRPNLLILDEPTNHMDIIGKEALEQMLREYEGTVLFVSHDRYFMDKVVDHLLVFNGQGDIRDFPGNYTQYRDWKDVKAVREKEKEKEAAKDREEKTAKVRLNEKRRMSFKEKREFEMLEQEIAVLEIRNSMKIQKRKD